MGELRDLADAKIYAKRNALLSSLHDDCESVKASYAARGMALSGETLVAITGVCSMALESLHDEITTQYKWAIAQSLVGGQRFVDELVGATQVNAAPLLSSCIGRVKREGASLALPQNAVSECCNLLSAKNVRACADVALALRSTFAELKRHRVRNIFGTVSGQVSRLFGGRGN
jgi:hypothetical protein